MILEAALPWVLAAGWGAIVSTPIAVATRRRSVRGRARCLGPRRAPSAGVAPGGFHRATVVVRAAVATRTGAVGRVARSVRDVRERRRRNAELRRAVPVAVDLVGVGIGAGATPYLAVCVAAEWAPAAVAALLARVERSCRIGAPFADGMDELGAEYPPLSALAEILVASDRLGAPVGPALARLAAEARTDTRRRAEARARALPVRLLFPLVFLVLPAFGLLTVVPALLAGLART